MRKWNKAQKKVGIRIPGVTIDSGSRFGELDRSICCCSRRLVADSEYSDGNDRCEMSLEPSLWTMMNLCRPRLPVPTPTAPPRRRALVPLEYTDASSKSIVSMRLISMPGSATDGPGRREERDDLPEITSAERRWPRTPAAPWRNSGLMTLLRRRRDSILVARDDRREASLELHTSASKAGSSTRLRRLQRRDPDFKGSPKLTVVRFFIHRLT